VSSPPPSTSYTRPLKEREKADIYLGKGRIVKDDPSKYPDKDSFGFLPGVTGGWAGGEVGLWKLRDEVQSSPSGAQKSEGLDITKVTGLLSIGQSSTQKAETFSKRINGKEVKGVVRGKGDDVIYVGKKSPADEGAFIQDDARKYPEKEGFGLLPGLTGGFAGGELGLQQYIEKGDIELAPPGEGRGQGVPLLLTGFAAAAAASLGAVLINGSGGDGSSSLTAAGSLGGTGGALLSPAQLLLLEAAAGVTGTAAVVVSVRRAIRSTTRRLSSAAEAAVKNAVFLIVLGLAVKAVLEN